MEVLVGQSEFCGKRGLCFVHLFLGCSYFIAQNSKVCQSRVNAEFRCMYVDMGCSFVNDGVSFFLNFQSLQKEVI